ncbi:hypothetical protein ABPG72_019960 [Tetrahymena utriculariae]
MANNNIQIEIGQNVGLKRSTWGLKPCDSYCILSYTIVRRAQEFYLIRNRQKIKQKLNKSDLARCHQSAYTKDWFKNKNVELFDWVVKGADLSPIEKCWAIIKEELNEKLKDDNESEEQLFNAARTIFYESSKLKLAIQRMYQSLPQNIAESNKSYFSEIIPEIQVAQIYIGMIQNKDFEKDKLYDQFKDNNEFIQFLSEKFQNRYLLDHEEEECQKFINKKENRIKKSNDRLNPEKGFKEVQITHKKISKQRTYSLYNERQLTSVKNLLIEFNFKDYQKIACNTGVKLSMIKKIAQKIRAGLSIRTPRHRKDHIDQLTDINKNQIISEFLNSEFLSLSLTKKTQRFNQIFSQNLRYSTYRNFMISQGFRHKSLIYSPITACSKSNKEIIFKTSIHMIENFITCDDVLPQTKVASMKNVFQHFSGHQKKFGIISYQIKEDSFNSGYFLNFMKKSIKIYQEKHMKLESKICIIMDNCRIHKMTAVINYMIETNIRFIFTAPYSSQMNPIVEVFGSILGHFK